MIKDKGFDYGQNGRFAYQPISEEYVDRSYPGQIIMNLNDGHISVNKNGLIVSITKEIEDKLTDINELKYDVDEQTDVVTNLLEDFTDFIKFKYTETLNEHYDMYEYGIHLYSVVMYLKSIQKSMDDTFDSLDSYLRRLENANSEHNSKLITIEGNIKNVLDGTDNLTSYINAERNTITTSTNYYDNKRKRYISQFTDLELDGAGR